MAKGDGDGPGGGERGPSLYESMMGDIADGTLAGGERLKVARLAERYGVSTSPVREVLRQLQGEGFVEFSPNRGATVREADARTLTELFELLQLLEPYFVAWFVEVVQPEDLAALEAIEARLEATPVAERAAFGRLDAEFHGYMYERHYNRRAVEVWRRQKRALNVFSLRLPIGAVRERAIVREHRELLAALGARDATAAAEVIARHVAGSGDHMSQQMRRLGTVGT